MAVLKDFQIIDRAIASRRSVRAFLDTPVEPAIIREILQVASRAPSGTNTQPWKVYVLTGEAKQRLSDEIVATFLDPTKAAEHHEEYDYYPKEWIEPFIGRRRKVGFDLYNLLGLTKEDKKGMVGTMVAAHMLFIGATFTRVIAIAPSLVCSMVSFSLPSADLENTLMLCLPLLDLLSTSPM